LHIGVMWLPVALFLSSIRQETVLLLNDEALSQELLVLVLATVGNHQIVANQVQLVNLLA
jgi:hypothetical protein